MVDLIVNEEVSKYSNKQDPNLKEFEGFLLKIAHA